MNIPILELKPTYLELKESLDAAYQRVMDSGWYLLGAETEAFEEEFAAYIGVNHCISVGNGLDALRIALEAHGVGAGDEVLVPAQTFIATWLAVTQCGATPIAVDVLPTTSNLNPDLLEAALTPKTRAIIPVHLYGQPAAMDEILSFAKRHGLLVIEDAAQAHGAKLRGRQCGALSHSGAFSFYPGKNLGAFSDGGAITTNDPQIAEKARMLRNYGSRQRYHHEAAGLNSRMDELQAAFLRVKLQRLDEWNARRETLAASYIEGLSECPDVTLPCVTEGNQSAWHLFVIQHPKRDALQRHLLEQHGIQTLIHYPVPPHLTPVYRSPAPCRLPIAEQLAATVLSLPIGPHFTGEQIARVTEAVKDFTHSQR